ncbi:MAG: hydrogenase 4 subunit B [Patescibacteria group bacterium]|jgi:hydrogenase-4 component B
MNLAESSFIIALSLFACGAIFSLLASRKDQLANFTSSAFAIFGSIFGIFSSILTIFKGGSFSFSLPSTLPALSFSVHADLLSGFFVLVISLIALFASIYGYGYVKHYYRKYNIGSLGFFYNAFIAGMLLVVTAHNALFFLIVWEIMSLASYFLVIYEKNEIKNIQAGFLYFIMTHVGTAFIILAFLLLYRSTGSFDFEVIKNNIGLVSPHTQTLAFIFALIGFGTKAGIIPLHIWLPSAHPAAPSHVSALMSGVMIKTGIFMLIRLFLDIFPGGPVWWGITILAIGSISSVLGVLYALSEHDIKKLLAYHSIENIGIILLGLGSALTFNSLGLHTFAVLSLVAALFHTLNHAIFKALLFMGAGSVIQKTGTRNIEKYGGIIKYMPLTALFFLIGSMAISALPPFNGFASEWITFQSLFAGIRLGSPVAQWAFIVSAGALALTGGLAAACFVKVFGVTFLARPRSENIKNITESSSSLTFSMGMLAALTLILGVFSGYVSTALSKVAQGVSAFHEFNSKLNYQSSTIGTSDSFASISLIRIFLILGLALIVTFVIVRMIARKQKLRKEITWDCGTDLGPRMEITATGFSRSIILIFASILRPTKEIETVYHEGNAKYFPKSHSLSLETTDVYKSYFYAPLQKMFAKASNFAKISQSGNVNAYILYIFIALIILLIAGVIK